MKHEFAKALIVMAYGHGYRDGEGRHATTWAERMAMTFDDAARILRNTGELQGKIDSEHALSAANVAAQMADQARDGNVGVKYYGFSEKRDA